MPSRDTGFTSRVAGMIRRHPLGVTFALAVAVVLLTSTARSAWPNEGASLGLAGWIALVLIAFAPVHFLLIPRVTKRTGDAMVLRILSAPAACIFGIVAVAAGAPVFVLWVGAAVSLVLLVLGVLLSRQ